MEAPKTNSDIDVRIMTFRIALAVFIHDSLSVAEVEAALNVIVGRGASWCCRMDGIRRTQSTETGYLELMSIGREANTLKLKTISI
jgi:hypothetical protein